MDVATGYEVPRAGVRSAGRSDIGLVRNQNEDAYLTDDALGLYVVADGVGGKEAGELASATAVQAVCEFVYHWRDAYADAPYDVALARLAVEHACREVRRLARERGYCEGMATTLTVLLVDGEHAVMGHVGDSRLHVVRGREAHQLSTDHTVVADLVAQGLITPAQALRHDLRATLSRSVGSRDMVEVDTCAVEIEPDDRFILSTDGMNLALTPAVWRGVLERDDLELVVEDLIREANAIDGHDNATVVVVDPRVSASVPETLDPLD
jgi:serine/threonine protein phosphatase PrpC